MSGGDFSFDQYQAVDFRRVAVTAPNRDSLPVTFKQNIQFAADESFVAGERDLLLLFHQTVESFLFYFRRDRISQRLTGRPRFKRKLECPDFIKTQLVDKIQ